MDLPNPIVGKHVYLKDGGAHLGQVIAVAYDHTAIDKYRWALLVWRPDGSLVDEYASHVVIKDAHPDHNVTPL